MSQTNLFQVIRQVLVEEKNSQIKQNWIEECKKTKLWNLWVILFETDVHDRELLETRIYTYGSLIREADYFHRDIFICLVAFLNLVIKKET